MELTELVVKVRDEGIVQTVATLKELAQAAAEAGNEFDFENTKILAAIKALTKIEKVLGAVERAERRVGRAAKEAADKLAEAQRDIDRLHAQALRDNKAMETAKRREMERTHAEALRLNREITNARKKAWNDAATAAERAAKREQAAQERLASHPFTAGLGRLLGQVKGGTAVEQAKSADLFRGKVFDFLVFAGGAKMAGALIMKYLVKPMTDLINTSVEFERQWALVTQTVTGSEAEMAKVRKEFLALAATRPFDPEQITAAARALGELGVATKEIIPATDYITRFSIASGIATDEAATLIGQTLAVGGVARPTADEIGQLASAVLDMGTNFAIGNKGVLTTMLRVSALIPTFHLSQEAALGLSTAMGSLGIKAERGATALQALLSAARDAEGTKLERFANVIGRSAAETEKLIRTNPGQFLQEFMRGFRDMADEGYNVNKMLGEFGIKTARGKQFVGSMANGVDTLDEAMVKANETMGKTDELRKQSDRQLQTTWALTKTLGNEFWALGVSLTEGVLPHIKSFIGELTDSTEALRGLIEKLKEYYDEYDPGQILKRAYEENERIKKELEGKGPLPFAGQVDVLDPNYDPIAGRIKIPQPATPYMTRRGARDEQLRQQEKANKEEDKRLKRAQADVNALVEQSRNAAQIYQDTKALLDEGLEKHWITPEKYSQAMGEATKKRDEDLIREAERTRKEIKKGLDSSASDQQKYNDRMQQLQEWRHDQLINDAQFQQMAADAEADRDKKKLAQLAKDQKEVQRFMNAAASARDKYNATVAEGARLRAAGRISPEQEAKSNAAALEKVTKAEERAAAASKKLTAAEREAAKAQRDANKLIEKTDPYVKFENMLEKINAAKTKGMTETQAQMALDNAYLQLMKDLEKQGGITTAQLDARNKKLKDYAISLNPIADMEAEIARARAAAAALPGIVTPEILAEHIADVQRAFKLPEEYEKTMRIVQGITERGMNAVSDTITDALWEGTTKGKEIMRSFAKDVSNILLEELFTKPLSESIIDTARGLSIEKFKKSIEGDKTQTTPGTENATDLANAADKTTDSLLELGEGALKSLLDLTSGIGAFLVGLLGGSGGGFDVGDLFKNMFIGGATKTASSYLGSLFGGGGTTGVVPDTTYQVPESSIWGQSQYDPTPGLSEFNVGTSAMRMGPGGAPPVNITVTALDPRTAASVIVANMPVIERGMQRAVDRGSSYAKAHGRRR